MSGDGGEEGEVVAVCRPEVAAGLALAGMGTVEAVSAEDAAAKVGRLARRGRAGVILVQEDLLSGPEAEEAAGSLESGLPMVLPFPGPGTLAGAGAAEAYVAEILRRAIGYRVRL